MANFGKPLATVAGVQKQMYCGALLLNVWHRSNGFQLDIVEQLLADFLEDERH